MIFSERESRGDILNLIQESPREFDNILALACVGAAFSAISAFEDSVSGLVLTSKAELSAKLDWQAIQSVDLFRKRHREVSQSTLGRLVTVLEKSGVSGRDIDYLRSITRLRNDFVHRLMEQVPLPGDWERYGFTLERFSIYTRCVARHIDFANSHFARIMVRHGLLAGKFGSYGAMLWNPDDEFGFE